eukprot:gnl/TRDRNA2_/TRDRNA2_83142_c1_seq1.p1 gnl/TRDRNA2_/TRDRNA2_83142_c1~~gnl/TRDRNA2_/TRDRNA2_83142_c1_seq1.p1  ORF type:complete len:877 (-),score=169.79 gnl/TRDRNA2_/TRDRNA2_83142_c1_seq1:63-2693(-)
MSMCCDDSGIPRHALGRRAAPYVVRSMVARVLLMCCVSPLLRQGESINMKNYPGCSEKILDRYPSGWPALLDVGMYFFGPDNLWEKSTSAQVSQFYDPRKPTVIYFHGWMMGTAKRCYRMTTLCDPDMCPHEHVLIAKDWLAQGWNVGMFYWDQFSDEDCAREAEQKIWFNRDGEHLRWKSYNSTLVGGHNTSTYKMYSGGARSVADMCSQSIQESMPGYTGSSMRFLGNSLGAQLAARCSELLYTANAPQKPTRLVLLDPYFTIAHFGVMRCRSTDFGYDDHMASFQAPTEGGEMHTFKFTDRIDHFTSQTLDKLVQKLWGQGLVTEVYKSSAFSEQPLLGDTNPKLGGSSSEHVTLVNLSPQWCGSILNKGIESEDCKHKAPLYIYLLQKGTDPPPLIGGLSVLSEVPGVDAELLQGNISNSRCQVPSAACSDDEIRALLEQQSSIQKMGHVQTHWEQVAGKGTLDTSDDAYKLRVVRPPQPQPAAEPPQPALKKSVVSGGFTCTADIGDKNLTEFGDALKPALGKSMGVTAADTAVSVFLAGRRLSISFGDRAAAYDVDYQVDVPPGVDASAVVSAAKDVGAAGSTAQTSIAAMLAAADIQAEGFQITKAPVLTAGGIPVPTPAPSKTSAKEADAQAAEVADRSNAAAAAGGGQATDFVVDPPGMSSKQRVHVPTEEPGPSTPLAIKVAVPILVVIAFGMGILILCRFTGHTFDSDDDEAANHARLLCGEKARNARATNPESIEEMSDEESMLEPSQDWSAFEATAMSRPEEQQQVGSMQKLTPRTVQQASLHTGAPALSRTMSNRSGPQLVQTVSTPGGTPYNSSRDLGKPVLSTRVETQELLAPLSPTSPHSNGSSYSNGSSPSGKYLQKP